MRLKVPEKKTLFYGRCRHIDIFGNNSKQQRKQKVYHLSKTTKRNYDFFDHEKSDHIAKCSHVMGQLNQPDQLFIRRLNEK